MTDMERALSAIVDAETAVAAPPQREAVILKAGKPATLTDMVTTLERVERELAGRMRREGLAAAEERVTRVTAAQVKYSREVSEAETRLARERDEEIHNATETYHAKLTELAGLLRRRP